MASVGCVMQRPFEIFVLCKVLGGSRCRAWVPRGRTEGGGDRGIPGFWNHVFPMGNPDVSRSVVAGSMWKAVRLWTGLELASFFFFLKAVPLNVTRPAPPKLSSNALSRPQPHS